MICLLVCDSQRVKYGSNGWPLCKQCAISGHRKLVADFGVNPPCMRAEHA